MHNFQSTKYPMCNGYFLNLYFTDGENWVWSLVLSPGFILELPRMLFFFPPQINLFLTALGICCCTWAFSSHGQQGLLFVSVHGLLNVWWLLLLRSTASRRASFSSCNLWAQRPGSVVVAPRPSCSGACGIFPD